MALTSVQLTHEVEKAIRSRLISAREAEAVGLMEYNRTHGIAMLALYSEMEKKFSQHCLTAGFFNKIVADMRHAGILCVNPSLYPSGKHEWVRLSDGAWTLHAQEQERLLNGGAL